MRKLGLAVVAAATLAGCGASTNGGANRAPVVSVSAAVLRRADFCSTAVLRIPTVRIPASFRATAAYECAAGTGPLDRATDGLRQLVAALARPDQSLPANVSCGEPGIAIGALVLVEPGDRVVRPRLPQDECGEPQAATLDILGELRWRPVPPAGPK